MIKQLTEWDMKMSHVLEWSESNLMKSNINMWKDPVIKMENIHEQEAGTGKETDASLVTPGRM